MTRTVKCKETNEIGNSTEFYKAPDGHYYKSEEIYNKVVLRNKCIDKLIAYAGYSSAKYAPTILYKMLNEIGEDVGFDVLYQTIIDWEESFLWANTHKDFSSESGRICYYRGIITNHILDSKKKLKQQKQNQDYNDIIAKRFEGVDMTLNNPKQKVRDIRQWL